MPILGRQISDFVLGLTPVVDPTDKRIGPIVSDEVLASVPPSPVEPPETPPNPVEPPGPTISDFVQTLEASGPPGDAIRSFVDAFLPPSPVEPIGPQASAEVQGLDTPPSPVEPPGPTISDFVQTLEVSGPPGDAIRSFVDAFLPPSPIQHDVPPSPIEPSVISDFVLEANPEPPGTSPGPPGEPPGVVISAEVHAILGGTDLSVSTFAHTGLSPDLLI